MSKTYMISINSIKTFCQGAFGAMVFGFYHQYTTQKMIELNNENQNLKQQTFINSMKLQQTQEMNELKNKLIEINIKKNWKNLNFIYYNKS